MRRRFLWSKLPAPHRTRLKPPNVLPDVLWTSILALNDSADAFPPLKSVVGGVVAIWQVAEVSLAFGHHPNDQIHLITQFIIL